jgi:hypothetical protein
MIRALLRDENPKTQTRRIVKPQPRDVIHSHGFDGDKWGYLQQTGFAIDDHAEHWVRCPYGAPGDRLWVRETWCPADCMYGRECDPPQTIGYPADKSAVVFDDSCKPHAVPSWDLAQWNWDSLKGKPSIHMPRWASRITLEVTGVRVERLQAITEEDAEAEGAFALGDIACSHREWFRGLWDSINAERAPWTSNPWVWVVEFKRLEAARRAA